MYRRMLRKITMILVSVLCLLAFELVAFAGPPLICHPFEIGSSRSLPWSGTQWRAVDKGYDINRLISDTVALLAPNTPVLVRMETLRRATVYAVWSLNDHEVEYPAKDFRIAGQLLARLKARTQETAIKSDKQLAALALFDYGYLVESYKQAGYASKNVEPANGVDGYGFIVKAITLRGGNPEMEFAAALAISDRPRGSHAGRQEAQLDHLQKAVAGAKDGSLLARNLVSHFGDKGKTLAELRASVGVAND
jgi:hypothetical protein